MQRTVIYQLNGLRVLITAIRRICVRLLAPYFHLPGPFLRRGDLITVSPYLEGVHEAYMDHTIDHFVNQGFNDFFIDIGANIGLTIYQNSSKFRRTIGFEPNELVYEVLKINSKLSSGKEISLFNFGIGANPGTFELWVPKRNFGGAFIKIDNSYTDAVLASKDGFATIDDSNYFKVPVEIIGPDQMKDILNDLVTIGQRGFVKIDVEGYESIVLSTLFHCLKNIDFVVAFENWGGWCVDTFLHGLTVDEDFDLNIYSLSKTTPIRSKTMELFRLLLGGSRNIELKQRSREEWIEKGEDVVLHVSWKRD